MTGASAGIGAATAARLARSGARVLLAGRDAVRLGALADRIGGIPIVADLGRDGAAGLLAEQALARTGRVDVLVNNAGVGWAGDFAAMPPVDIAQLVAVNLTAPLTLTRLLLPAMRERGRGHAVMVSSIAGCVGVAREAAYAATKAGLNGFCDSLRDELAGTGVGVSVVVPGVVDTEFFARRGVPYQRTRPRPIPPERVAAAVVAAVERDRAWVYAPSWMRLPARVHGAFPGVFRWFAARATGE
ncbi:MAG TPA: SDR family NAD(P)-dependent oxidoreductase [Mycobacteriales bacterium]|nr:SDR family NAD(P)-dependent oxidoreductase [Mycobacteriales bacterium]